MPPTEFPSLSNNYGDLHWTLLCKVPVGISVWRVLDDPLSPYWDVLCLYISTAFRACSVAFGLAFSPPFNITLRINLRNTQTLMLSLQCGLHRFQCSINNYIKIIIWILSTRLWKGQKCLEMRDLIFDCLQDQQNQPACVLVCHQSSVHTYVDNQIRQWNLHTRPVCTVVM